MKKIVRLTENDLHRIIRESVKRVLRETDYNTLPNGGFDSGAFNYDQALKDAQSEEEWDKMMRSRHNDLDVGADIGTKLHPQVDSRTNAFTYTHGDDTEDKILDNFKKSVEYHKREDGFAY